MNFDDMAKEEYDMFILLKNKNRMEIDEILGKRKSTYGFIFKFKEE